MAAEIGSGFILRAPAKAATGFTLRPPTEEIEQPKPAAQKVYEAEPWMNRRLIDIGRGSMDVLKGVEQLDYDVHIQGLKDKARGKTEYRATGNYTPNLQERRQAKDQLEAVLAEKAQFMQREAGEIAQYEAGTQGENIQSMLARGIGSAATVPIPGLGAAGGGIRGAAARIIPEMAIGAGTAGLEFVPEGQDKLKNALFAGAMSGVLKVGTEAGAAAIRRMMQGSRPSRAEAEALVDDIRESNDADTLEIYDDEGLLAGDRELVQRNLSEIEIETLTPDQMDNLAVFREATGREPTRGQVTRDYTQMGEERRIARQGDSPEAQQLRQHFEDQNQGALERVTNLQGDLPAGDAGRVSREVLAERDAEAKTVIGRLYDEAELRTDPSITFYPHSMAAVVEANKSDLDSAVAPVTKATVDRIINTLEGMQPEIAPALRDARRQLNQEFGNTGFATAELLRIAIELKNGINAEEANIIRKAINAAKPTKPDDIRLIGQLRTALNSDLTNEVGEDVFADAVGAARNRFQLLENIPVIKKLGIDQNTPDEQVFSDLMLTKKVGNREFGNFLNHLREGTPEQVAQGQRVIDSIRGDIFRYIADMATNENIVDSLGRPTFKPNGLTTALNNLSKGGMDKLQAILSPQELASIATIRRFAALNKPPPAPPDVRNPSGTGAALWAMLGRGLSALPGGRYLLGTLRMMSQAGQEGAEGPAVRSAMDIGGLTRDVAQAREVLSPDALVNQIISQTLRGPGNVARRGVGIETGGEAQELYNRISR